MDFVWKANIFCFDFFLFVRLFVRCCCSHANRKFICANNSNAAQFSLDHSRISIWKDNFMSVVDIQRYGEQCKESERAKYIWWCFFSLVVLSCERTMGEMVARRMTIENKGGWRESKISANSWIKKNIEERICSPNNGMPCECWIHDALHYIGIPQTYVNFFYIRRPKSEHLSKALSHTHIHKYRWRLAHSLACTFLSMDYFFFPPKFLCRLILIPCDEANGRRWREQKEVTSWEKQREWTCKWAPMKLKSKAVCVT